MLEQTTKETDTDKNNAALVDTSENQGMSWAEIEALKREAKASCFFMRQRRDLCVKEFMSHHGSLREDVNPVYGVLRIIHEALQRRCCCV